MNLTYKRAHKYFTYNATNGELRWKKQLGNSKVGELVGYWTAYGGAFRIKGKAYQVHRVIWLMMNESWPKHKIRHLDGDVFNNRPDNLKDADRKEIIRNSKLQIDNKSGAVGVSFNEATGKWEAKIRVDGVQTHLGLFVDLDEAKRARKHGELYFWSIGTA